MYYLHYIEFTMNCIHFIITNINFNLLCLKLIFQAKSTLLTDESSPPMSLDFGISYTGKILFNIE